MQREFYAPARVNLIGEHTDYTGGYVLPMAIPFRSTAAIATAQDGCYTFISELFSETRSISLDDRSERTGGWSDYPIGVLRFLQARGIAPRPFTLRLQGDVPLGAGLSSSASVEVASLMALLAHTGVTLNVQEIALLCQKAENEFVGSPCGIMDQFVITAAKAGHALLLNTRDLTYEHLPMNEGAFADTCIVVCNSMVKHSIADGDYGLRRRELEAGQAVVVARFPKLRDLGDATISHVEACKDAMSLESFLRCRHIVTENVRVLQTRQAMLRSDPVAFGQLMLAAHISERDDFACSCDEVDFLVDSAAKLDGCLGARLTGGGFGGCTVNLVQSAQAESFAAELRSAYQQKFQIAAETYVCTAVDGAVLGNAKGSA